MDAHRTLIITDGLTILAKASAAALDYLNVRYQLLAKQIQSHIS
jgi:hypothetical protein